ncbi:hypothetical protein D3C75_1342520 [compost metagenome]
MADHPWWSPEPAADLLDIESPGLQHLRILGRHRHLLILHARLEHHGLAGVHCSRKFRSHVLADIFPLGLV